MQRAEALFMREGLDLRPEGLPLRSSRLTPLLQRRAANSLGALRQQLRMARGRPAPFPRGSVECMTWIEMPYNCAGTSICATNAWLSASCMRAMPSRSSR